MANKCEASTNRLREAQHDVRDLFWEWTTKTSKMYQHSNSLNSEGGRLAAVSCMEISN